jgi:hypothetical protein
MSSVLCRGLFGLSALAALVTLAGCENDGGVVPNSNVPTPTPTGTTTPGTPTPTPTPVSFVGETFHQGYSNSRADILWIIDNSGSMGGEQAALSNSFSDFINGFVTLGLDFHLGVITTDMDLVGQSGKLQGSPAYLTQQTPNIITTFQARVQVGTNGSATEEGLLAAQTALSPPLTNMGQQNYGFLRDDAVLSLLYVSDEDDFSPGVWPDYVNFISGLKADPAKIQVSSIVGPAGGCNGPLGSASDGADYRNVASSFNGINVDICNDDFTAALQEISDAVTALATAFPLTHVPIPGTLQVLVGGVSVPGGASTWSYNPVSNEILFESGAVPPECSDLEIRYALAPGQFVTEPAVEHPDDPGCTP